MEPHTIEKPQEKDCGDLISIAALNHPDGRKVDLALSNIVNHLRQQGYRLAGVIRARTAPSSENHCDLLLEDLSTATLHPMSQNLGAGSNACRLDDGALDAIAAKVEASLQDGPDIVILNKFGKQEAEGRGLRGPIVDAVNRGIPVLVGLNPVRSQDWTEFCGAGGERFDPDDNAVDRWLEAVLPDAARS